jgi:hypothetical protein
VDGGQGAHEVTPQGQEENIPAGIMKTQIPTLSNDVNLFPGAEIR